MPAIVRIGDPISCGDTMAQGSGNVYANGIPVSRELTDNTAGHCFTPTPVASGSSSRVLINGIPVDRVGDPIVVHCCPGHGCHGGSVSAGSPNVYVDSGGGGGAIIDNTPPYTDGTPPPPGSNALTGPPPDGITIGATPIESFSVETDEPDTASPTIHPSATLKDISVLEEDLTAAPPNPPPVQDCSDVDSLPANFTWDSGSPPPPTFRSWAESFQLSPNFTVADLCFTAVSTYMFTSSVIQSSGLTQKEILQNMCYHAKTVLEPLLAAYGPFIITSGFRNKTGTSQHNRGQATDIQFLSFHGQPNTGELYFELAQNVRDNINFDQLILEWFGRNPWLHITSDSTNHRNNVLTQVATDTYSPGLRLLG